MAAEVETRSATRTELATLVLSLIGLAVSVYLTIEHYAAPTALACPETGSINCTKVTTSQWATVGPIPLALLGAIFFLGMTVLCAPPAWRRRELDIARLVGASAGVVTALYLVWVELFKVEAICLWCTVVHVVSLFLLIAILWATTGRETES